MPLALLVARSVTAATLPAPAAAAAVAVTAEPWMRRPFADVVLDAPELAACIVLAPGAWSALVPPASPPDFVAITSAAAAQLAGVPGPQAPGRLRIVVGESERGSLTATSSGATTLLVLPAGKPLAVDEAARAVIEALLRAHTTPAAPDERCSEPLLALAEAIALAGSSSLALLPPALRPVADWLERKDAKPPLAAFSEAALDGTRPWLLRRARLRQVAQRSVADPALLHAAALVVEAFGDLQRARERPFDLLLAWRDDRERRYPDLPPALRRALANPQGAGMPEEKQKERAEDEKLIAADARERAIESGAVGDTTGAAGIALPLRELAAAQARSRGTGNVCRWLLASDVPAGRLTGCRGGEQPASYVAAVPRAAGGFQVVAATASGEAVLLRWPRWLLFPAVLHATSELAFIDELGVWSVALDGAAAPRLVAEGAYRYLAVAPDSRRLATVSWPAGSIILIDEDGSRRDLGGDARGGLAWIDGELLVAAGGEGARVVTLAGVSRGFPGALPCSRTVARASGQLLVGSAPPCEAGVGSVSLGGGEPRRILARADAPLGIVPAGDGFFFGDFEGIHRFLAGEKAERVGGGLTPGPG